MNRRYFFLSVAGASAARALRASGARITRIRVATLQGRFAKFVTMNAYDRVPKGHTYDHPLIRIETDQGVEGVGPAAYAALDKAYFEDIRALIGADPLEIYRMDGGQIKGRSEKFSSLLAKYKHLDGALFDLIGKLTGKAAWQLMGPAARERVEVYDGTLYFSDVWFRDRGVRAVVEEAEEAIRSGYAGVKLKMGRGSKWMEQKAGLTRDIAVAQAVREAVGSTAKIMVDQNNGYSKDISQTWTFLSETKNAKLHWIEEPFPENVEEYGKLKDQMAKAGMRTFLADGENLRNPADFTNYLKPRRLMDVVQLDIRTGGFIGNTELARMAEPAGAVSVPHNWGSQLGFLMGLQIAKAVNPIVAAEDDRSTCDVLTASGYHFEKGAYTVSSEPGLGVKVNAEVYDLKCKPTEKIVT
jgi:L-alanine-DL-glutamate epimerase-like enolase superfamily enzyme